MLVGKGGGGRLWWGGEEGIGGRREAADGCG